LIAGFFLGITWWTASTRPRVRPVPVPPVPTKAQQKNTTGPAQGKGWRKPLVGLLRPGPNNDGDSFLIQTELSGNQTFRLYGVDCPEKAHHFQNGPRLQQQGNYFGGLSQERTMALGQTATERTLRWLREEPFEVITQYEGVYDSGRFYAHIRFPQSSGDDEWLANRLVKAGLARIYTKGEAIPGRFSRSEWTHHLHDLEAEARRQRVGGWAN
jgi:endonuclease YncB( thermonuclease family)